MSAAPNAETEAGDERETPRRSDAEQLREAFGRAADALSLAQAGRAALVTDLIARLSEPHRRYHGLAHVASCVALAEQHAAHAQHPAAVVLALLFHDAVYDPRAADNEARSAALAEHALASLEAPPEVCARVGRLVRATAGHDAAGDVDAELVLSADLAVLGASEAERAAFEHGVREEYAFVDAPLYAAGRARILSALLARERLFEVPAIASEREATARSFLAATIASLTAAITRPR